MSALRPPQLQAVGNVAADSNLRSLRDAVRQIQDVPAVQARIIPDVVLADGVDTTVAHGLGRLPTFVRESCPRSLTPTAIGATGRVQEIRNGKWDRSRVVVLRATGWGVTIAVDVEIM